MMRLLEQIEDETGMIGTIMLGGPEPDQGGKIVVMTWAIHSASFGPYLFIAGFTMGGTR
jgi:hypothetical protein